MIDLLEEKFSSKERYKNGQIISSVGTAKTYRLIKTSLNNFTQEVYKRSLSSYYFKEITEKFLLDYTLYIKKQGIENGNKGGLVQKLRKLRAICRYAEKQWDCIKDDKIIYERIKFPKQAKPLLISKTKQLIEKYRGTGCGDYVFPIFTHKHDTDKKKISRVNGFSGKLSQALTKACKIARIKENITWYSARGSFITRMVDQGYSPYVVAEMAGNSPMVIYKHYYKNTHGKEMLDEMNSIFGK
ncbi:MAG: phage integrase SAM-like domain-containing protein [Rikenellaceae bacterium]